MSDRFAEGYVEQRKGGKFAFIGEFDDISFTFEFDTINIDCVEWMDLKRRGKYPSNQYLNEIRDVCNDRLLDDKIDLFQCVADIFDAILNDGFKFDDKAEIIFGDK